MPVRKYQVLRVIPKNPEQADSVARLVLKPLEDTVIKFKTPAQEEFIPVYHQLIGQRVSIDVREGEMNGDSWTVFKYDGEPEILMSARDLLKSGSSGLGFDSDLVDSSTGEIKDPKAFHGKPEPVKSPLDFGKKAG